MHSKNGREHRCITDVFSYLNSLCNSRQQATCQYDNSFLLCTLTHNKKKNWGGGGGHSPPPPPSPHLKKKIHVAIHVCILKNVKITKKLQTRITLTLDHTPDRPKDRPPHVSTRADIGRPIVVLKLVHNFTGNI